MENIETDWTKEEFKAYLLTYAAKADYFESEDEKELISKVVSGDSYKRIHREIDQDNDYQSINKILYNLEKYNYQGDEVDQLIVDIQELFLADGKLDLRETNFLVSLKRIMK